VGCLWASCNPVAWLAQNNTFTISNTAATWGVDIPAASITLNAGEGADFTVTVSIPEAAADSDDDAITITVTGAVMLTLRRC
jgi:hypothetical protein